MPESRTPGSLPAHRLSAVAAVSAIRSGTLSSEELVRSCLERIAEREPSVSAWQFLDPDLALAQARARDAEPARGPLHGVPVGVKDIFDTVDQPTTYGSPIFAGHRPTADALAVERLRRAGAVILGKTVTPEFTVSGVLGDSVPTAPGFTPKTTRNPLDPTRTAGKSSSGSSAAVADHMVPLALGTQTAASVIGPASYCGIWGFKPSHDAIPVDGLCVPNPSLDTIGCLARDHEDLVLCAEVLLDAGLGRMAMADGVSPRIGFVRTPEWEAVSTSTQGAILELVDRLSRVTSVREVALPPQFEGLVDAHETVMHHETTHELRDLWPSRAASMSPRLQARLDPTTQPERARYEASHALAETCRQQLAAVFAAGYDVLLAPCMSDVAPVESDMSASVFGRPWTLLGVPTLSVPMLHGAEGLPIGVQLIGPSRADAHVLRCARWIADHR